MISEFYPSLRQCEWDHANCDKQKYVKCAPKQMRFNTWISLPFHVALSLLES
jgi:hypothetical protein